MENSDAIVRQLLQFVQEQRAQNERQESINNDLNRGLNDLNRGLRANFGELRANLAELKEMQRQQDKRWTRMFKTHEDWLKDHERRLVNLWRTARG